MSRQNDLTSVSMTLRELASNRYIADRLLATIVFLARQMEKPLFLEGEPGVGKTEIAIVLSKIFKARLIRLQCYEGLDAASALYEWNYPKQLLRIRMDEAEFQSGKGEGSDIYSEPYLIKRPLLDAILCSRDEPVVLLIDEVDRADEEFEAFLLEVLSSFQVSVPEIGTIRAVHKPLVIITSNRTRDVHDALKRRCLYHWIDYPDREKERKIIRARVPRVDKGLAEQVSGFMQVLREEDLIKKPGISESLDWATAMLEMNKTVIDEAIVEKTLGCILKYREDIELFKTGIWPDPSKRSRLLFEGRIPS